METSILIGLDREAGSTLPLLQQLRFDAGSPALNLLSTVGRRRSSAPIERMGTPERLQDWLAGNGLPPVPADAGQLSAVMELREAAYRLLAGHGTAADLAIANTWSSRPMPGPCLRLQPDGTLTLEQPPASFESLMSRLARVNAAGPKIAANSCMDPVLTCVPVRLSLWRTGSANRFDKPGADPSSPLRAHASTGSPTNSRMRCEKQLDLPGAQQVGARRDERGLPAVGQHVDVAGPGGLKPPAEVADV